MLQASGTEAFSCFISFHLILHQKLAMEIVLTLFIYEETVPWWKICSHRQCVAEAGIKSRYFKVVFFLTSFNTWHYPQQTWHSPCLGVLSSDSYCVTLRDTLNFSGFIFLAPSIDNNAFSVFIAGLLWWPNKIAYIRNHFAYYQVPNECKGLLLYMHTVLGPHLQNGISGNSKAIWEILVLWPLNLRSQLHKDFFALRVD